MELNPPLMITDRLLPGVSIDAAEISVRVGRPTWAYIIDLPTGHEFTGVGREEAASPALAVNSVLRTLFEAGHALRESQRYAKNTEQLRHYEQMLSEEVIAWAAYNISDIKRKRLQVERLL